MKYKIVVPMLSFFVAAMIFIFMPTVFLPKRWLDIQPGQERSTVHAVLGVPDADYSVKGFDGWHNSFGVGASVMIVRYDERLSKVIETKIETKWGVAYREWVQEYKSRLISNLTIDTDPQHQEAALPPSVVARSSPR